MPHNSILGLWAFCGPFGFTGLMLVLVVGVYFASRSYQQARDPDQRVAAFMAIAMVLIYLVHCWGDIGFSERRSIFLVGPALAIAGQLAMSTGAWRGRTARRQL
jgi:O-antigen ligase